MLSSPLYVPSVMMLVTFSGISVLNAFFTRTPLFGRIHESHGTLKASLQSRRDIQLVERSEPLFRSEHSLYQNKVESIRRIWEVIDSFGTSGSASDKTFSAKDFQDEKEYAHIKDIEVSNHTEWMQVLVLS